MVYSIQFSCLILLVVIVVLLFSLHSIHILKNYSHWQFKKIRLSDRQKIKSSERVANNHRLCATRSGRGQDEIFIRE